MCVCVDKREKKNAVKWWGYRRRENDSYFPLLLFFLSMKKRVGWKKKRKKKWRPPHLYRLLDTASKETRKKEKLQFKKEKIPSQCEEFS